MSENLFALFVFIVGFGCWLTVAVNMVLAVRNRKPEVPLFPHCPLFSSPFNILFTPSKLTERGLLARKRCFIGVIGFFTVVALAAVAGAAHWP